MSRKSLEPVSLGEPGVTGLWARLQADSPATLTQASWGDKDTPKFRGKLNFFLGLVCSRFAFTAKCLKQQLSWASQGEGERDWENLLRQEETQLLPPHPHPFHPRTSEPSFWLLIKAPDCLPRMPLLGMGVRELPRFPRG